MGNINNNENTADNSRTEIDIAEIFGMLAHKWIIIVINVSHSISVIFPRY